MVDASYLEGHRPPPGAAKRFLDQAAIPAAIDALGGIEAGMERVAVLVRQRPAVTLGTAVLLGLILMRGAVRLTRR